MSLMRAVAVLRGLAIPAAILLALTWAGSLPAQTLNNTFGGLSENSNEPIDIESDTLTVYDAEKYATFRGDVKAVQGTTTLRAAELIVHYVGGGDKLAGQDGGAIPVASQAADQKAEGGQQTQISKIEARGSVVITSEDDQTTTSDWALYDVPAQLVTVGGNVVLTQDQNVLKGDRLVINLQTGESRFENTGNAAAGGRIRALFMPKGGPAAVEPKTPSTTDGEGAVPDAPGSAQGEQTPKTRGPNVDSAEPLPLIPEYR